MNNVLRTPYVAGLPLIHQGKVRDTYAIPGHPDLLLMVATDAISTHNVCHLSTVPGKGHVLTALSVWWVWSRYIDTVTHILACGRSIYDFLPHGEYPDDLHLRALVVRKLYMVPFEFIFRARMAGSLWKSYQAGERKLYGYEFPDGLELMSPLDFIEGGLLFTPTEKSATDDPVSATVVRRMLNSQIIEVARRTYYYARAYALGKGIDIIDFKAEVGVGDNGFFNLGDEWLNGDCCRFVRSADIVVGQEPPWADKEIFRQEAVRQWGGKKSGASVIFPQEVIAAGQAAYRSVFQTLTGSTLEEFQKQHFE